MKAMSRRAMWFSLRLGMITWIYTSRRMGWGIRMPTSLWPSIKMGWEIRGRGGIINDLPLGVQHWWRQRAEGPCGSLSGSVWSLGFTVQGWGIRMHTSLWPSIKMGWEIRGRGGIINDLPLGVQHWWRQRAVGSCGSLTGWVSSPESILNRPIYIGKNQNPKNLGFLLYRLHCQKNP